MAQVYKKHHFSKQALHSDDIRLTPLEPQSRFGDKLLEIWLVCSQNGTAF